MHRTRTTLAASLITIILTGIAVAASPSDDIKYRKAVMQGMAAHIGALSLISLGRVDHKAHARAHADALAVLGGQMQVLFPAGSDSGDTEALPLIWQERERFDQGVAAAAVAMVELRDAVTAGEPAATTKAFKSVGDGCKGCHDRYRKETD